MLHIHNGDCAANIAKQTAIPGEHFAFREALLDGPTPAEFKGADFRLVRARHLWQLYGVELNQGLQNLRAQEEKLASCPEHEEVVLWFEHDLFCQIHLIYLLDWFRQKGLGTTKLSLVCVGEFPGRKNFRGLGELTPPEFASLFPARQPVTQTQLELAVAAWQAYCSPDPTDIEAFLQAEAAALAALPFLAAALAAHLRRFPSTRNGLGQIENRALQLIADGVNRFSDLFAKFGEAEPVYGLGDAQFWTAVRRMMSGREPLIEIEGLATEPIDIERKLLTPEIIDKAKFKVTEVGKAMLRNEADFVFTGHIDYWLGGVELLGSRNLWRWDEEAKTVILSQRREAS
jgi:hypothetical protein